jgi:hypothetical protein
MRSQKLVIPSMPTYVFAMEHRSQVLEAIVPVVPTDVVNVETSRQDLVMGKLPDNVRTSNSAIPISAWMNWTPDSFSVAPPLVPGCLTANGDTMSTARRMFLACVTTRLSTFEHSILLYPGGEQR